MKKNLIKMLLTTAMVATIFIGTGKEAKAMTIEEFATYVMALPVKEVKAEPMFMEEYYANWVNVPVSATYDTSTSTTKNNKNAKASASQVSISNTANKDNFDHVRYATDYPDLAAVFGQDKDALYNHYINNGAAEGRKAYYTDGTPVAVSGVAVSHPEMLALVNADRAENGVEALTWNAELEAYALQRVLEVSANFHSSECLKAANSGDKAKLARIGHSGSVYDENAALNYHSTEEVNAGWIGSKGHHQGRILNADWNPELQYAAASYIDPTTGWETWIEVFR